MALTPIPATPEEAALLQAATSRLQRLLTASEKFALEVVSPPREGSPIDFAYKHDQREAFDTAYRLMFAAEDHLRVILQLCSGTPERPAMLPSFALFSLLRVAAEAVLRAHYLLDPSLSHAARLARSLNERLSNLEAQDAIVADRAAAPDLSREEIAEIEQLQVHSASRKAHLTARAKVLGIQPLPTKKDPALIHAYGEPRKKLVDLFREALPSDIGLVCYRLLSGHVHSMQWAQMSKSRAEPTADPKVGLVSTEVNIRVLVGILDPVVTIHDENVGWWCVLAGQPPDVWRWAKQADL